MQTYEKIIRAAVQFTAGTFDEDGNLIGERIVPAPNQAETLYYPFDLHTLIDQYNRELRGDAPEAANGRSRRREEVRR